MAHSRELITDDFIIILWQLTFGTVYVCMVVNLCSWYSPLLPAGVRLTDDNVFKVLKKANKGWKWVAKLILHISSSKCDEFERRWTTDDECLKQAIQFWLKRYVYASWRWLIFSLDHKNLEAISDGIRQFAEPLTGKGWATVNSADNNLLC